MAYTPYVWPTLVAVMILCGIALYVRRYRDIPAARPFSWLMWQMAAWALLSTMSNATVSLHQSVFLTQLVYVSNAFISVTIFKTSLEYIGQGRWLTARRLALLMVIPAGAVILSLSCRHHTLWFYDFRLDIHEGLPVLSFSRGPLFWVASIYYFCLNVVSLSLILTSLRAFKMNFWITIFLFLSLVVPLVAGVLFNFGISPVKGYNFTPMTFIWTGALFLWAILRLRMFSFIPVARNMVMETIEDLVIVLNNQGLLVDFNRAAKTAFGINASSIGRRPDFFPPEWTGLFEKPEGQSVRREEATLGSGENRKIYDLSVSPICDGSNRPQGSLFLFHDVTSRKSAEEDLRKLALELKSRNEELQQAVDTIKTMSGLIPICAWCGKRIKNKEGKWVGVEAFINANSEATMTHGICPECFKKHMEST